MQLTPSVFYDDFHWNSKDEMYDPKFACRKGGSSGETFKCGGEYQDLWVCLASCLSIRVILIVFDRPSPSPVKVRDEKDFTSLATRTFRSGHSLLRVVRLWLAPAPHSMSESDIFQRRAACAHHEYARYRHKHGVWCPRPP